MMTKWWYLIYWSSWLRGSHWSTSPTKKAWINDFAPPNLPWHGGSLVSWLDYIYIYIPGCPGESLNWLLNRYHPPTTPSRTCLNWEYCWLWDAAHAWDAGEKPKETSTPAFSFSSFPEAWGPGLTFHLTSNPSPTSHNCGDRKRKVQATTWLSREWTKNQTQQGCCIYVINTYTVYIYIWYVHIKILPYIVVYSLSFCSQTHQVRVNADSLLNTYNILQSTTSLEVSSPWTGLAERQVCPSGENWKNCKSGYVIWESTNSPAKVGPKIPFIYQTTMDISWGRPWTSMKFTHLHGNISSLGIFGYNSWQNLDQTACFFLKFVDPNSVP